MKWDDDDDELVPPTPLKSPPTAWKPPSDALGSAIAPRGDSTVATEATLGRFSVATKFLLDLPIGVGSAFSARVGTVLLEHKTESGRANAHAAMRARASREAVYDTFAAAVRSTSLPSMRIVVMDIARYIPMQTLSLAFKDVYRHCLFKGPDEKHNLTKKIAVNFASGGVAGLTSLCFVYPLDYARALLGTDVGRAGYLDKGLGNRIVKIVKQKGPLGLYKGFFTTAPSVFIYHATLFGIFDTMKTLRTRDGEGSISNNQFSLQSVTDYLASMAFAWIASSVADLLSSAAIKARERKLKKGRIKDVFFKYSLSSAFRSFGVVMLLAAYDDGQHGLQFILSGYHRF